MFKRKQFYLRCLGITLRRNEHREFEVYPRGRRKLAYYTNDLNDAFDSGIVMFRQFNPKREEN